MYSQKHVSKHIFAVAVLAPLVSAILFIGQAKAAPLVIQPGQDGFVTEPGSSATLPALPAGFFGVKNGILSDLIPSMTIPVMSGPDLVGIPVVTTFLTGPGCHTGMVNVHCYEQQLIVIIPIYDTVVERTGGIIDLVGDDLSIDIELVHLSLQSVAPLPVTYGTEGPSFFDIFISLDGDQSMGNLTLHRLTETSGTMDTQLPVDYKVTFQSVDFPNPIVVPGLTDLLESVGEIDGNRFEVVPEPSTYLLFAVGLLGIGIIRFRRWKKTA